MAINRLALVKTGDTTFDKIFAHYIDEKKYTLSKKQEEIKERWLAAWTLRITFHSTDQAINVYMNKYSVSRAQAFRDISRAERLFGSLSKTDKDGKRAIWSEYIHKYYLMAIKAKDLKSVGNALKLMERAYELDSEDNALVNFEKLLDKPIKLSVKKTVIEMVVATLDSGIVDLNNPVIDVDYEEVEDE